MKEGKDKFCEMTQTFVSVAAGARRNIVKNERNDSYWIDRKKESEDLEMKKGYTIVRRLKLTPFELRVAIDALNAKRLKDKANGIYNRLTSDLILQLLDALEA